MARVQPHTFRIQECIMPYALCPGCDEEIYVPVARVGAKVTCRACKDELEVVGVNPVELDWAYDEDEEWDDDENEDDDFE